MATGCSQGMVDRALVLGEGPDALERVAPGLSDRALVRVHQQRYRWAAGFARGRRVLDLGCGTCYGLSMLRAPGSRVVVGIDRHLPALVFGREAFAGEALTVLGNVAELPIRDGVFDTVVCFEVIEHVRDQVRLLKEAWRVLGEEGTLFISTPNAQLSTGANPYHVKELSLEDLLDLLQASGFCVAEVLGQVWKLKGTAFHIRGLRRAAYEFGNRSGIRSPRGLLGDVSEPAIWCVRATRGNASMTEAVS